MISIGLVGSGPWANEFQAPMLARATDVEFAGIWARNADAAAQLASQHEVAAFASFDAMLDGCDAVAFAVPPAVQSGLAVAAARAGKHLMLEKPIAATLDEARAIATAVESSGVASLVLLRNRFGRPVQEFLAACGDGAVRSVTCSYVSAGFLPGSVFATPWRTAEPHALLDLGPHALDLVDAVAGPVTSLAATVTGRVLHVTTRHESGATGSVVLSGVTPGADGPLTCTAVTDAGRFELADPEAQPRTEVQAEVTATFVRAVAGEETGLDVHRALALQRLFAAAETSLRGDGRFVDVAGR